MRVERTNITKWRLGVRERHGEIVAAGREGMDADLQSVADALSDLADAELKAVVVAANEMLLVAAGLLSWLEHAADWELNRRAGLDTTLHPPTAAIPPEASADSLA